MRARVYVDGFNFYYGAVRGKRNRKWLDFRKFSERIVPSVATLDEVHYFTTRVSARPNDPDSPTRQDAFLRALKTLDRVFVHEGAFKATIKRRTLVDPQPTRMNRKGRPAGPFVPLAKLGWPTHAWAYNTEEKQSDVNLAVKLVADYLDGQMDVAVVVSDDTDLSTPVAMIRNRGCRVLILSPRGYWLKDLAPDQKDLRRIHPGVIEACQLPDPVAAPGGGQIRKPHGW